MIVTDKAMEVMRDSSRIEELARKAVLRKFEKGEDPAEAEDTYESQFFVDENGHVIGSDTDHKILENLKKAQMEKLSDTSPEADGQQVDSPEQHVARFMFEVERFRRGGNVYALGKSSKNSGFPGEVEEEIGLEKLEIVTTGVDEPGLSPEVKEENLSFVAMLEMEKARAEALSAGETLGEYQVEPKTVSKDRMSVLGRFTEAVVQERSAANRSASFPLPSRG